MLCQFKSFGSINFFTNMQAFSFNSGYQKVIYASLSNSSISTQMLSCHAKQFSIAASEGKLADNLGQCNKNLPKNVNSTEIVAEW